MATAQMPIADMTLPPITLTPLSDFMVNPPRQFFRRTQQGLVPINQAQMNFYFTDTSDGTVLTVNSEEELEDLCNTILNYPILFNVNFKKEGKTVIPCPYVTYVQTLFVRGEYVVTVWPQHPVIQPQLLAALNTARQEMAAGKRFAIDLSFRSVLKDWFENVVADKANGCCTCHFGKKLRICITNKSQYLNMCRCDCPENCVWWTLCSPCWLIGNPIYTISRYCVSKVLDYEFEIEGSVKTLTRVQITIRGQRETIYVMKTEDGRLIEDIRYRNRQPGRANVTQQPRSTQPPRATAQGAPQGAAAATDGSRPATTAPPPAIMNPSSTGAYDVDLYRETMEDSAPRSARTTSDKANLVV
ncbi:uncharacterized protein [Amphiura filiformis]|uniref:uncharacterized protein n=1 Tax=Amphiura filiformis TaxID=82378 RepID=UPI003B21FB9A